MAIKLLGVNFQRLIKTAFRGKLLDLTLTKVTPGVRGDNPTEHTEPTVTAYACEGFEEAYSQDEIDGDAIRRDDRRVMIAAGTLGEGLVVPVPNDQVVSAGVRYRAIYVDRDPASATYTIHARKV